MNTMEIQLPYTHTEADLIEAYARKSGRRGADAGPFIILRKSVDARKKQDIRIVYLLAPQSECPPVEGVSGLARAAEMSGAHPRVIVAGAGPSGLFATLFLALAGCQPLLIERGQPVEQRQLDVARFWKSGILDPESNVQFGEGGAGTFSDGKLSTGIRDPRCAAVLEEFVMLGAPPEILYLAKPHIGTDRLRGVMTAMRAKITSLGGEIRFGTRLAGLVASAGPNGGTPRLTGVLLDRAAGARRAETDRPSGRSPGSAPAPTGTGARLTDCEEIPADALVLAIGHSARDTFRMLQDSGITIIQKPFAVGVRIEHRQTLIDLAQYGAAAGHPALPPAEYRLSCHLAGGRSVYTFCMCPGGQVIAAASSAGESVTNGMSLYHRDNRNANSALLVPVQPVDFASDDPLAGVHFQEDLERRAFQAGGGQYQAPAQLVGSFLGQSRRSHGYHAYAQSGADDIGNGNGNENDSGNSNGNGYGFAAESAVDPSYTNGVRYTELADVLPGFVTESLREGLPLLAHKLPGFADPDAVLTGVETRSSSPVRIVRDDSGQASLPGLFPCGEGAGYAGGIMSAAVDGLRCAESVLRAGQMANR